MFFDGRTKGAVNMTVKRYDGRTRPEPKPGSERARSHPLPQPDTYMCLVRATLGKKKITTVVNNDQVELFYAAFRKLLISSMDSLKRQKKPKTKRTAEWFPNTARLRAEFYIDILCWLCCLPCVCFTVCTATRFWNETRVSCSNLFLSLLLLFVSKLRVPPPPHHPC